MQRLITLSHARSWSPIVAGLVLTVLVSGCGLTILSLAWSLLVHRTPPPPKPPARRFRATVQQASCCSVG